MGARWNAAKAWMSKAARTNVDKNLIKGSPTVNTEYFPSKPSKVVKTIGKGVAGTAKFGWKGIKGAGKIAGGVGAAGLAGAAALGRRSGYTNAAAGSRIGFLFLLTILIHVFDWFGNNGFSRGGSSSGFIIFLYTLIAFLAAFIFYRSDNVIDNFRSFIAYMGVSVLCVLFPWAMAHIPKFMLEFIPTAYISSLVAYIPIWPILIYAKSANESRFVNVVGTTYLFFWLILFTAYFIQNVDDRLVSLTAGHLNAYEPLKLVWKNVKDISKKAWQGILDLPENTNKFFERMKAEAAGEYYTGNIDQNAKERLGVYIDELKASDEKFYEDQPVTIWGTLVVKTIDEDVKIKIGCTEGEEGKELSEEKVDIFPKKEFEIALSEQEGIECTFKNGSLREGDHSVGLKADFNFLTMAYTKTYFMDTDARRALISKGIDPLERYGISDKNPTAVYTAGPINIGLSLGSSLPLVTDRDLRLAITLTNQWEGKLKAVNDLYIITPKEIIMTDQQDGNYYCNGKYVYAFEKASCADIAEDEDGCDDASLHNVFRMKMDIQQKIKDIENFETLLCRFKIENKNALLGDVPISTKYFKVVAKYNYSIHKEINVEVKSGDGLKTFLDECGKTCDDKDGCYCGQECEVASNIEKGDDCGGKKSDTFKTDLSDCTTKCDDNDGCTCMPDCKNKEVIYGEVCGAGESIVYLADCNKQCESNEGCRCNDDCVEGQKLILTGQNCGGYKNTQGCESLDWSAQCPTCKVNSEYKGVFCVGNKWECTNIAQSDQPYHSLSECP